MDQSNLQAKLGALSPAQREQLLRMLAAQKQAAGMVPSKSAEITGEDSRFIRVPDAADYAPSFAQKRLWLQEQLSAGASAAYNVPLAVRLRGSLDAVALEQALRWVMDQHAILRTRIVRLGEEPRQVVIAAPNWHLEHWSAVQTGLERAEFTRRAESFASQPFVLEQDLPFRAALMPLGPQEHGLALVFHHIACDGRSVSVFVEDLERCYASARQGQTVAPAHPSLRYVDYAAWHRTWLESTAGGAKAKAYWLRQFAELPEPIELPGDKPRPSIQDFSGDHVHHRFSPPMRARLAQLGQRVGASLFGTLLASVVAFLHRYAGRDDITIGTPTQGRPHPELDRIMGFFVNTLPLRTRVKNSDPFLSVVERVRDGVLDALEHQGCPFDVMVQSLPLERDLSRPPLFSVMMGLTRAQEETFRLPSLQAEVVPLGLRSSKVDLTFHFVETSEALELDLEFATALFTRARMLLLVEYFDALVSAALDAPHTAIGDLSLMSPSRALDWAKAANPPRVDFPHQRSLPGLFRDQVARTPDAPAVMYSGVTSTYAQLDRLSDAIAGHLIGRLGPLRVDEPIALQVDRSERMLAAVLGILKAGGCYLPINPGTPAERVRTLLALSGARLRLVEGEPALADWAGSDVDLRSWCTTPAPVSANRLLREDLPGAGRRLAYIIFTSGSTGEPKGVLIEQHSVVRLVCSTDFLQLGPNDRVLQTGSLAFDASTFEIWAPLLNGGCCCLPQGKEILEIDQFDALLKSTGATTCFLTTGLFNQIADFHPQAFARLRHLLTGGEKVSVAHVQKVMAAAPHLALLHVYGPTENTTFSTWYQVKPDGAHDIPIGRPIAHSTIYILDERGNLLPPGVTGEIYCGGDGLARGYLGRPDATAERFVPDPFSDRPGARLYRTGDFGRWDIAGNVQFAGRKDDQVKIRGFRIELGEVELRLRALPSVQQAVVIARPAGGTHELVAYIVGSKTVSEHVLRESLVQVLPDYMVPSYFVVLDALPLNASGKVNRKALPAPQVVPPDASTALSVKAFELPKEHALAVVWTEVLGRAPQNVDAHYFNSGGDSIKAIQMTARLRKHGYRLTLREVFARPRFGDLAAALVAVDSGARDVALDTGEVPLTPIQHWFLQSYQPPYDHFNQATLLESEVRLNPALLRQALERVVLRHGMLRCRLERSQTAPGWKQTIPDSAGELTWQELNLIAEAPATARTAMDAAIGALHQSLCLTDGRLVAAGFFRLAKTDRLLLVIHHWAVDGISWRIVLDELESIYRSLVDGQPEPALPAPTSFRAWSQSMLAYAQTDALGKEAHRWDALTRQIPVLPVLPQLPQPEQREIVFNPELTAQLLGDAHRAYGTKVEELLLAAFGKAWAHSGGGDSVALAMEGHGRESCVGPLDVSSTVGWFTSLWPFLLTELGESSWSHRIRAVKDALRAVPSRGVGYGIARYLLKAQAASTAEVAGGPRVSFNYLGVFSSGTESLFRGVVDESTGEPAAVHLESPFDLDVVGEVSGGKLRVSFQFHRSSWTASQRSALVETFQQALVEVIAQGRTAPPVRSLSDFTGGLTNLNELDRLLAGAAQRGWELEDIAPLTPMQEGMVFHSLYEPDSPAYSDQVVLRLLGPLDATLFEAAWQDLGQQYPNLRSVFLTGETERPVALIVRGSRLGFAVVAPSDAAELETRRAAERAPGFQLDAGPLLKLTLVQLGAEQHEVWLGFHHSILDGWSSGLIWQRLEANYRARANGQARPSVTAMYRDFLHWLRDRDAERDLSGWRTLLAEAPPGAAIPLGAPRLGAPAVRTRSFIWEMGQARTDQLTSSARRLGTTENSLFQALWGIFIGKLTRTSDVVFGATVSGRAEGIPRVEEIVGLMINTIPVRVTWNETMAFQELAELQRLQSADSMERLSVSLADIQNVVAGAGPLIRHTLVFENYPNSDEEGKTQALWQLETVAVHDPMHFEFGVLVVPKRDGWLCRIVADDTRYPDAWLHALQHTWHEIVDHFLSEPQALIESWSPKPVAPQLHRIAIAATFTAEPMQDALRFWLDGLGEETALYFAPFNQVLQQLLDPASELQRSRSELNVLLVRLEDWAGSNREQPEKVQESLDLNSDHFIDGLQQLVQTLPSARYFLWFCPAAPASRNHAEIAAALAAAEKRLLRRIDVPRLRSVQALSSQHWVERYPSLTVDNFNGDNLGGVPYSEEFFAILATEVIRRWDSQTRAPLKVLALDADNTLWQGILGEDGVAGLRLTEGHRLLQEVAKTAQSAGMLLAVVSKNNPADLQEALAQRSDFALRWDDFVAVEAGWRPKSESLRELAKKLKLGLESFVFVDDSALECAEVRAALPEVLVLQVPVDAEGVAAFARHFWPGDVFAASAEDKQRSELYRVEARREQTRQSSGGLKDFIQQLQLEVRFVPVDESNLERAAQLTQRTNQFNVSTIRRTAVEVREWLTRPSHAGYLLEVKDRFGDYGVTGFLLYRDEPPSRVVDTLLLSCRVLGRGVEYELLRGLARSAMQQNLGNLRIPFTRSGKNIPAEQFLRACLHAGREESNPQGSTQFVYTCSAASRVEVVDLGGASDSAVVVDRPLGPISPARVTRIAASYFYQTIATKLASVTQLMAAVESANQRIPQRPDASVFEAPLSGAESQIALIWAAILRVERVGRRDNFFGLGGHSLKAVMMLSRVNRALGLDLLLETIFAAPVLADFALCVQSSARVSAHDQAIPLAPRALDYPLSNAQRRLWLIEQMRATGPSPFHMPAVFQLKGKLDPSRLTAAFEAVIERHESLRSGLVLVGSEPRQCVWPKVAFKVEELSVGALESFLSRDFNLAHPPLLRVGLQRHDTESWTLAVVMHHAISDGWSISVMAEELSSYYQTSDFVPPPLALQYKDYAVWQDQQLAQGRWQRAADFWLNRFKDRPNPLELPSDRSRPAVKQSLGADLAQVLPLATWNELKGQAQRVQASPFVALLAVLQLLIARQARTSRFVIGTPVAGRDRPELEPQIGFFVNLVAMLADLERGQSFSTHLSAVRTNVALALSHAHYPFDRLVTDLNLPRDLSRSPLFDVLMVYQGNPAGELSLGAVQLEPQVRASQTTQYDVTFEFAETSEGLRLRLEYDRSLFDESRMDRMIRQFFALLQQAFAHPTSTIENLELCPLAEQTLIRRFERASGSDTYRATTIPALVAAAGRQDAKRTALVVGERRFSYGDLEQGSLAIACKIRAAGAGRQELVAVAGERTEVFIFALLGVMRAGCVYVPLDLKHPDKRLKMVLEDGGLRYAIAIGAEAEQRLSGLGLNLIDVDRTGVEPLDWKQEHLADDDLAYVIFTSGSTGRPKGVEITHGSFATMITSKVAVCGVRSDDRCSWWASCAFDASLAEIFLALTSGATLVIAEETERSDPTAFLTWLKKRQVTVLILPPAFLRILQRTSLAPVRILLTAGEAADKSDLLHYAKSMDTFNAYGPTETSVCATMQRVAPDANYERVIPIGCPLDGAAVYVLDEGMRRVPLGVPGELFIGGRIVGRGYRGRPTMTAERFLSDPFSERSGARMYRTGDLVRWRDDGTLEFIGREDGQVKIRGFRIELGEVESAVRQVPGVRAAAVLAVDRLGATSLVAYVVMDNVTIDQVRSELAQRLPDYMRPAAYVCLDSLPQTPNGKLDKSALPSMDWIEQGEVAAPETELERALARGWKWCLGTEHIGRESDFFALGGDSIKALSLVAKLRAGGWTLSLKTVFAHPRLLDQACFLEKAAASRSQSGRLSGSVLMTPIQKWFLEEHADSPLHHFNQSLFYEVSARIDLARLQRAVQAVWERHPALRSVYVQGAVGWEQIIAQAETPAPQIRWLEISGDFDNDPQLEAWVQQMQTGLNLTTGPLVQYGVVRGPNRDRVICVTHHLVSDWVSHRILLEDLETAYTSENAASAALPPAVTELDEWTREGARWAADTQARRESVLAWNRLYDAFPPSCLPEVAGTYGEVMVLGRSLDQAATSALRTAIAGHGSGALRDAMLAALVRAEGSTFGAQHVSVQLEGHGREDWTDVASLDVSRTVGWFTSLYPCVLTHHPEDQPAAAVSRVSTQLAELSKAGFSYSWLRSYGQRAEIKSVVTRIGFNFLGEFATSTSSSLFRISEAMPQGAIAPGFRRDNPLDITAYVMAGRLTVHCAFLATKVRPADMQRWLDHVELFLKSL
jgi:amino acid adenylation domain-containing protein/FkbH-like protein/non-ribosomal peptide synthase protein (TIGR01720 family)